MYIGDLHIHSRYSRATSKDATPEHLELWARKKGIDLIGTGDFTHPAWRQELEEKLEPEGNGLYVLKEEYRIPGEGAWESRRPRFVVTGEISSIYKKKDRVRKVHSVLILPGLEDARRLTGRLELIGNIHSDGRPILGLDCRDLLEIMLETSPEAIYVPAHIWTPHFSLFGAFSGFDRIEDCFEDLTPHIHALETGLSSDPPMNWRLSALDRYQLISSSDAHSPSKLGREATLFDGEPSWQGISDAVQRGKGLAGTVEFFPEEGKYHFDGHRKCGLCISPAESRAWGNVCPVCGKKITIGVQHRVEELADRPEGYEKPGGLPFESLVPLPEVIAASTGRSAAGKKVQEQYEFMLSALGPEFGILRQTPVEDIRKEAGPLVAEGIRRLREGRVERSPGFDGEYGSIRLLSEEERSSLEGQMSLFFPKEAGGTKREEPKKAGMGRESAKRSQTEPGAAETKAGKTGEGQTKAGQTAYSEAAGGDLSPNALQQEAIRCQSRAVAVVAGPGTGKTKTLLSRLMWMLTERGVDPARITAVTFTNQAAGEMRQRLEKLPGGKEALEKMRIGTFHAICSRLLSERGKAPVLADEGYCLCLAKRAKEAFGFSVSAGRFLQEVSLRKSGLLRPDPEENGEGGTGPEDEKNEKDEKDEAVEKAVEWYREQMRLDGLMDYDDLLLEGLALFGENPGEGSGGLRQQFQYLLVDEFQDVNPVQYGLILAWNRDGRELFVIGDPDQSIYGFRGSDAKCFERLERDFPDLARIGLAENYRSAGNIVRGALSMISHNPGGRRSLRAVAGDGQRIRAVTAPDERSEAIFIAKEIGRMVGGIDMLETESGEREREGKARGFSEIAVLYRTHRQAGLLETCLRREGIPYVVAGREDFLEQDEVINALTFFEALLHPGNATALERAMNPLGRQEDGAGQFALLAKKYRKKIRSQKPFRLVEEWAKDRGLEEDDGLRRLADMAVLFGDMEAFLDNLSSGTEGEIRRSSGRKFSADAVSLMTFHGSKGLEFPAVFLYGVRRGLVPLEMAGRKADPEEERRLFYVGMTRAKEELILTASKMPSAFLEQIDPSCLEREAIGRERQEGEAVQMSLFDFL